jgi:molybdenum cofactor biosynthesis protein MoaC
VISTERKTTTLRTARASATVRMSPAALETLRARKTPKGDALEVARVAGVMAAKRTSEIIPFCHPLPLDQVTIEYEFKEDGVTVISSVTAVWKTGVEMEALLAVQVAATALFDMLKMVDPAMRITDVHVAEKTGGKSDFRESVPEGFRAAVIVTSDGTAAGKRKDRSGRIIKERLEKFGVTNVEYVVLPDEAAAITQALAGFHARRFHLVVTTGGTGLGPRDVTVDATRAFIDREIPGIMEAARSFGQQRTPRAMLSRGVAGLKGGMMIVNLPGSSRGTEESLDAIFPALLHGYTMMGGGGH